MTGNYDAVKMLNGYYRRLVKNLKKACVECKKEKLCDILVGNPKTKVLFSNTPPKTDHP